MPLLFFAFVGAVTCIGGFVWLVAAESRPRGGRHWTAAMLLYGLPLAGSLAVVSGTVAFCAGLNVVGHDRITFDTQSVQVGAALGALLYLAVCAGQLLVIGILRRLRRPYWVQLGAVALPLLVAAAVFCARSARAALPEQRFRAFIGIDPPRSVSDIRFHRRTLGFATNVRLTCRAAPADARLIVARSRPDCEIVFDATNGLITATYNAD